jgi:hypothetical protein
MSCVLRVSGNRETIEVWLIRTGLHEDSVWAIDPRPSGTAAANIVVSPAGLGDLEHQLRDAIAFLSTHGPAVRALVNGAVVTRAVLDFGLAWKADTYAQFTVLPMELIRLLADSDVEVSISHYAVGEEERE